MARKKKRPSDRAVNNESNGNAQVKLLENSRTQKDTNLKPVSRLSERADLLQSCVVCVFLAAIIWTVFGQTLRYGFVSYDDNVYVYENSNVTQGLTLHSVAGAFTHLSSPDDWLPLTAISHTLDWKFYRSNAGGHHLTNVVLHTVTAILLFLVLRKMTGALWKSAFVAAVFAIHPLRVESVAWVAERKDVLSGLFFMLTLWAYVRYAQKHIGARPAGRLDYCMAILCFAAGLLSKSMLVTLPFVLLLLDYWPLRRFGTGARALLLEKIPFFLLSATACALTVLTQKETIVANDHVTLPWRIANAVAAYAEYLAQSFYPVDLAVLYPHPANYLSLWAMGVSASILIIISAAVVVARLNYPYLLTGWLWFLGMLVPVIGLVQVGVQAHADRYTYLPQIGLCLAVTWGAANVCVGWRYRRAILWCTATAVLGALLVSAHSQTRYWKDSVALWEHDLNVTPDNSPAQSYLGLALAEYGKTDEAIQHYERALSLKPDNTDARINLGNALVRQGKANEAIPHYEQAQQLEPNSADVCYDLGNALYMDGKPAEAVQQYERAVQLNPNVPQVFNSLGVALMKLEKLDQAGQQFQRALQLRPDYVEALNNFAVVLASEGKMDEAMNHLQQALKLATNQGDQTLANAISERIKIFQNETREQKP